MDFDSIQNFFFHSPSICCQLVEGKTGFVFGNVNFQETDCQPRLDAKNKRSVQQASKRKFYFSDNNTICAKQPKRDVGKVFEELNLIPDVGSDLQCMMCSYKATQKPHLKTHYKLKHLGGADLIIDCPICKKSIKTKSNLKKHLMKIHDLDDAAATKMISWEFGVSFSFCRVWASKSVSTSAKLPLQETTQNQFDK